MSAEPYRPSNGTEGDWFFCTFCMECERDRLFWADEGDGCDIAARSLIYDVGDPEYPTEWIRDENGPRCTAFLPLGSRLPTDSELEAEGQVTLFPATEAEACYGGGMSARWECEHCGTVFVVEWHPAERMEDAACPFCTAPGCVEADRPARGELRSEPGPSLPGVAASIGARPVGTPALEGP